MCRREIWSVSIEVVEESTVASLPLLLQTELMLSSERFENIYHATRRHMEKRPQSFSYISYVGLRKVAAFFFLQFLVRYQTSHTGTIFVPLSASHLNGFSWDARIILVSFAKICYVPSLVTIKKKITDILYQDWLALLYESRAELPKYLPQQNLKIFQAELQRTMAHISRTKQLFSKCCVVWDKRIVKKRSNDARTATVSVHFLIC